MKKYYTKNDLIENTNLAERQIEKILGGENHELIKKMTQPYSKRVDQIKNLCSVDTFRLNFIGDIGVGKSTALCHLMNFIDDQSLEDKSRKANDICILKTAGGRTTLCETVIKIDNSLDNITIEIEALDEKEFEKKIDEFCDNELKIESEQVLPQEVVNVLINMSGYPTKLSKKEIEMVSSECLSKEDERAKKSELIYKKKKEYISKVTSNECVSINKDILKFAIMKRVDYLNRNKLEFVFDKEPLIKKEIKTVFERINSGLEPHSPFPKKIVIKIPHKDMSIRLPKYISEVIDSKGLDGKAVRSDIQKIMSDNKNIIVLCDSIPSFGNIFENDWLCSMLTHTKDLNHRCFLIGLEKMEELKNVNNAEGDRVQGSDQKQQELKNKHGRFISDVSFKENNILFYNALYGIDYNSEHSIERFQRDKYEHEKIEVIKAIENSLENMYNELCVEIKELRKLLSIFEENRISDNIRHKFNALKIEISTYIDELKDYQQSKLDDLPKRISVIHAGSVRGSVNRNGKYYNCDIYSECSQIGSYVYTEACNNRLYSLKRFLEDQKLFDIDNEMEVAIKEALKYKIDQEYSAFELNARRDYYTISENNIYHSLMWDISRNYWGDRNGNYRNRVVENIMSDLKNKNTEYTLGKLMHGVNFFKNIYEFIDEVTK